MFIQIKKVICAQISKGSILCHEITRNNKSQLRKNTSICKFFSRIIYIKSHG